MMTSQGGGRRMTLFLYTGVGLVSATEVCAVLEICFELSSHNTVPKYTISDTVVSISSR